ncbi:hypothetical protein GOP47_0027518 [Adiantum capillus-veneris]|nr:hypothetical protein GOP47_0027518 [Adiantum capillus-veneris]
MARARLTQRHGINYLPKLNMPKLECKDAGRQYVVNANLAGFEPSQVKVELEGSQTLVVRGCSNLGQFHLTCRIPPDAWLEGVQTNWCNGFLTVIFPKSFTPYRPPYLAFFRQV